MYSIRIIDSTGEHELDLKEQSFPFNIENGSIADLTDRSASWSYSIELPRTPNNNKIFSYAGTPYVANRGECKRYQCNVYANGIQMIHRGVLFIESSSRTSFTTQIVSGSADVFEKMKDIVFDDETEEGAMVHEITLPLTEITNADTTSGVLVRYPSTMMVSNDGLITQNTKDGNVYQYATPIVSIGSPSSPNGLLMKILDRIGYTLVTDTSSVMMENLHLAVTDRVRKSDVSSDVFNYTIYAPEKTNGLYSLCPISVLSRQYKMSATIELKIKGTYMEGEGSLVLVPHNITPRRKIWEYFLQQNGEIRFVQYDQNGKIDGGTFVLTLDNLETYVTEDGVFKKTFEHEYSVDTSKVAIVENEVVYYGDLSKDSLYGLHTAIGVSVEVDNQRWTTNIQQYDGLEFEEHTLSVRVYDDSDDDDFALPGQTMLLEKSLGISDAYELFKIVSLSLGWIVSVDQDTKTIYAYTFNKVLQNKSIAKDWSDKLVNADDEFTYTLGNYARKNYIRFKENKANNYEDSCYFGIDNANLDSETDAITIDVSSGRGKVVEWWIKEDDKAGYKFQSLGSPRIVGLTGANYTTKDVKARYGAFINNIKDGIRVLTATFNLSELDIYQFEEFAPIYLRQYGAYFYVNKIDSWEAGKLCSVELLQLNT